MKEESGGEEDASQPSIPATRKTILGPVALERV